MRRRMSVLLLFGCHLEMLALRKPLPSSTPLRGRRYRVFRKMNNLWRQSYRFPCTYSGRPIGLSSEVIHLPAEAVELNRSHPLLSAMTIGAGASAKQTAATSGLLCFQSNQPNNLARDCLLRLEGHGDSYGGRGRGTGRGVARCYRCDGLGHFASSCPRNENGGGRRRYPPTPASCKRRGFSGNKVIRWRCNMYCSHWLRMLTLHRSCAVLRIVDGENVDVMTVNGQRQRCEGVGRVQLCVCNGDSVVVDVYVVDFKPLGFEVILGINGISALGGVTIFPSLATRFGLDRR